MASTVAARVAPEVRTEMGAISALKRAQIGYTSLDDTGGPREGFPGCGTLYPSKQGKGQNTCLSLRGLLGAT